MSHVRWSTSSRSSFQLMTGVTVDIGLPRSIVICVKVDNRLPCSIVQVILLQQSHCTLSSFFLDLLVGCSSTWRCAYEHFSKSTSTLGLVEQAFWMVPPFTTWVIASSFEVILARRSDRKADAEGNNQNSLFHDRDHRLIVMLRVGGKKSLDVHVLAIRIPTQIDQLLSALEELKTSACALKKKQLGEQDENRPQDSVSTSCKKMVVPPDDTTVTYEFLPMSASNFVL